MPLVRSAFLPIRTIFLSPQSSQQRLRQCCHFRNTGWDCQRRFGTLASGSAADAAPCHQWTGTPVGTKGLATCSQKSFSGYMQPCFSEVVKWSNRRPREWEKPAREGREESRSSPDSFSLQRAFE